MRTNMVVVIIGVIVIVVVAIFLLSKQNTTIAPEKSDSPQETSQLSGSEDSKNSGSNGVIEGDDQGAALQAIDIEMKNFAYSQPELRVKKGSTVTWKNEDGTAHTVTASDNSFDSGSMAKGATFSHTFTEVGTFDYSCTFHPNMKGKIIVE
jgi:amicyanin